VRGPASRLGAARRRPAAGLLGVLLGVLLIAPAVSAASAPRRVAMTAIPSSFRALSASFISSSEGWVLGSVKCGVRHCPALVHTTNAGASWSSVPAPATGITASRELGSSHGISTVRFANAHDGWLFDPDLWATHDGGRTWTPEAVHGAPDAKILALEAANGTAHLVLFNGALFRIASTPVHANGWTIAHRALTVGAGPVPEIQLVLHGSTGWVLQNDRTVVDGARLSGGTWVSWAPACGSAIGPAFLADVSSSTLFAVCDVGLWSTPAGEHLYRSTNGGASFARVGSTLPTYPGDAAAAASSSTIEVIGLRGSASVVEATFNGGLTWHQVMTLPDGPLGDFDFTNPSDGFLTVAGRLYLTRDGGHSWSRIAF
jgi:photosystem II stability/assembly factor-like uncharacterized protein